MNDVTAPVQQSGRAYTIASLVMAVLALALVPPLFGAIGVGLGLVARRRGDPRGTTAVVCCVVATVVGLALWPLVRGAG